VAITIKKTNGWSALQKLGVPEDVLSYMIKHNVSCKLTASAFEFTADSIGFVQSVPVKLDDLMAQEITGKMPSHTKSALLAGVLKAVKTVMWKVIEDEAKAEVMKETLAQTMKPLLMMKDPEKLMAASDFGELEGMTLMPATGALSKLPKVQPKEETVSAPKPIPVKWPEFPPEQKKTAPLQKLRDATMMYQPVHGTSANSRYYVVAANDDLRIAARVNQGTLSVRIEGSGWTKYTMKMDAVGFSKVNSTKQYSSMHLNVGLDKVTMSKTLGAILLGLGIPMDTPIPDLEKIPVE
jgi:hypothetical protein